MSGLNGSELRGRKAWLLEKSVRVFGSYVEKHSNRVRHTLHFSEFIIKNMEAILQDWEEFANSLPPGVSMSVAQLRDHAKKILEVIAEDMSVAQSKAEQKNKSLGEGRVKKLSPEFAKQHAQIRYDEGFNLIQVLSEYRALRASIIRLWTGEIKSADKNTLYELTRFNEEVDEALTYAVEEYAAVAEKTREAAKHKDEFLAVLAHELRNPLAPVQTGIEVLRLTEGMPAATVAPLNMMGRQIAHLVRLIDDLLDISRINLGKVSLSLETVAIADVIANAVDATAYLINAENRKVSIEISGEPLIVRGDPVRLTQVVENLLSNASKYTYPNGHISILVRREGEQAKIVVRDDGVGIAAENVDKLFEMFKQLDNTHSDGLGVGLALVLKLVELHDGSISASSEGLGHGAEFEVSLPLLMPLSVPEGSGVEQASVPGKKSDGSRGYGWRVLVVDDNLEVAESMNMLLQLLGAQTCLAHDGPSALEKLKEFLPNLVLLDIGLPGMDGYEVARQMRKQAEGRHIMIIAVSGWGQDEDRQRSLQSGIDEHLVKPINVGDIERMLAVKK